MGLLGGGRPCGSRKEIPIGPEYERLNGPGQLEKEMGMHVLPWQQTPSRIFGRTALGVGLAQLLLLSVWVFHGKW